jgi:class 3 adenylate cyclase/isopentenyldiphosphate isomerase
VSNHESVVALFVDVRGFTKWSEANEVFANLDAFIKGFLEILSRRFPSSAYSIKPLGDGAMIVREFDESPSLAQTQQLLRSLLTSIRRTDRDFKRHCQNFAERVGHGTDLRLGWGVVRGKVRRVGSDWAGGNLNKCSRLCNEARPFGVIIDRDDFPQLPRKNVDFVPEVRRLAGIADQVPVWVTPEIASQFVPRERLRETPEVHVAGTCLREIDGRLEMLVARRSESRRLYPGKLEGCGGQLRLSESFADGVRRHFSLELGLDVEVLTSFHTFYEIREPDEPLIPGIRFLCRQIGSASPRSQNHSEVHWISEEEFQNTPGDDFVADLKDEVLHLLRRYRGSSENA